MTNVVSINSHPKFKTESNSIKEKIFLTTHFNDAWFLHNKWKTLAEEHARNAKSAQRRGVSIEQNLCIAYERHALHMAAYWLEVHSAAAIKLDAVGGAL